MRVHTSGNMQNCALACEEQGEFLNGVPVLYVILHIKVIDEQRTTEFCITHCLIQGET